jgi:chloramphenicol 3-O-phosphotransferase
MNIVVLYGPPASGKLTVAKKLAALTGFTLLHNHLIADLASSLFPYGTREYSDLASAVRHACLSAALSSKSIPGLILTFAYGVETYKGKDDDLFIKTLLRLAKRHHGKAHFVKLECSTPVLMRRLNNSLRRKFKKLTAPNVLRRVLNQRKVRSSIPFAESFVIDTGKTASGRAARLIREQFGL